MDTIKLTPQQVQEARAALMTLNRLLPQVEMLEECGEDCQQRRETIQRETRRLEALLTHFGGDQ